jgi:cholesterol transport system auxiliary component
MGTRSPWPLFLAASLLCACALTSKSEPLTPRYFAPEYIAAAPRHVVAASTASAAAPRQLRLGDVLGGTHLRERMLFRDGDNALGYYEERRWTERPEDYLRRALARALFEERGLQRVVAGAAPTLEVELIAFEEVRAPVRKVRLQAVVLLHDERVVRLEETVTVERPVRGTGADDARAVVAALSEALRAGVTYIADRVAAQIAAAPPAEVPDEPGGESTAATHPVEASGLEH